MWRGEGRVDILGVERNVIFYDSPLVLTIFTEIDLYRNRQLTIVRL
jgi:hypothetical protein